MLDMIRMGLPKGRMQAGVFKLLQEAGIELSLGERGYRPSTNLAHTQIKLLKSQSIVEMLHLNHRDVGFAGLDWVRELRADVVELLDTQLDVVRIVAAAPESILVQGQLPQKRLVIASEYVGLAQAWAQQQGLQADIVRSYGATEVLPPEDADCIIDNTATGSTLAANQLCILDTLMTSSTRLYASHEAMKNPFKKQHIENFVTLIQSVLAARQRVMLEANVDEASLEAVIRELPAMGQPTISTLFGHQGFAVKAAVPKKILHQVILSVQAAGAKDIVVTQLSQIVM